jgi:hypothetical protein
MCDKKQQVQTVKNPLKQIKFQWVTFHPCSPDWTRTSIYSSGNYHSIP